MAKNGSLPHKVVLIDYDEAIFSPMGFEAEMLAAAGASWEASPCRSAERRQLAGRGVRSSDARVRSITRSA